jgi:nitroreductase
MQTWDAIRARRNVRQYSGEPVAREDLERICEAGRRAPSAGNWQPWDFVVVTGREQLVELAKVWERGGRHIASSAATIALVAKEPEDERQGEWLMYDFGQATAYMMLAAADLGIGSGHSAVIDQGQARRVLGFPGGLPGRLLDRSGLPGRPGAAAAYQAQPAALRTGRALAPLVAHATVRFRPPWTHHRSHGKLTRRPDLPM